MTPLITAALGALGGALYWRRVARRQADLSLATALARAPRIALVFPAVVVLAALQVAVVLVPEAAWALPVWLELHYPAIVLGGIAACIAGLFGFVGYGAVATRHRARFVAPPLGLLLVGVVAGIHHDFTRPLWPAVGAEMKNGVVLQTTGASCAAASAANLARLYGMDRSEREMARRLGTTRYGSSPAQVAAALRGLGFSCEKRTAGDGGLASVNAPAVLFYPPGLQRVGHAVLLERVDGGIAVVQDPLVGRMRLAAAELERRWSGHAVSCAPAR